MEMLVLAHPSISCEMTGSDQSTIFQPVLTSSLGECNGNSLGPSLPLPLPPNIHHSLLGNITLDFSCEYGCSKYRPHFPAFLASLPCDKVLANEMKA